MTDKKNAMNTSQANSKVAEKPKDLSKHFFTLDELEIGKVYFCRLSGLPVMITDKDTEEGKTVVKGKMYIQQSGAYSFHQIDEKQLFLWNSEEAPSPND